MKTKTLMTVVIAGMFTVSSLAQNQQIPNGGFENWHIQGQGEDPDDWGSLFNQFNSNPSLVVKTNDAHTGTNALKLVCDTGTVPPPLGTGIPGDTIYGSAMLGLVNGQVGNAKWPFASKPDSLTGYIKGTVINGGLYMNMALYKAGQNIGNATYFFVASAAGYTRFSVSVNYSQSVTPDTMTFMIIAAHPGLSPKAHPDNEFYIDDLALIYNTSGINDAGNNSGFAVFPNPAKDHLVFVHPEGEKAIVKIIDATGKRGQQNTMNGKTTVVNIRDLATGLYFYQVSTAEGNLLATGKFLKQ
ncbi:MAG: T9SS type A sorting domain-containing protein [Bacteroidetes bacterium]|nr:T9SS type A sorting domain-containing protein [Bacteroidota bacterium]